MAAAPGGMQLPDLVAKLRVDWTQLTEATKAVDKTLKQIETSATGSGTAIADVEKKSKSLGTTIDNMAKGGVKNLFSVFKTGAADASKAMQGLAKDVGQITMKGGGGISGLL